MVVSPVILTALSSIVRFVPLILVLPDILTSLSLIVRFVPLILVLPDILTSLSLIVRFVPLIVVSVLLIVEVASVTLKLVPLISVKGDIISVSPFLLLHQNLMLSFENTLYTPVLFHIPPLTYVSILFG